MNADVRIHTLRAALCGLGLVALAGCAMDRDSARMAPGGSECPSPTVAEGSCTGAPADVKLNDLQAVGSHNSYKRFLPPAEQSALSRRAFRLAIGIDYGHVSLTEQLDLGMRQIELDIVHDPEGGRYADPLAPRLTAGQKGSRPFDKTGLLEPGFKVLHIQDIDVHSTCATLILCLTEIRDWSTANPDHGPILIMMNAKDAPIDLDGAVVPLPFNAAAFDALDGEILSVFARSSIVMPDDVRGDAPTLRDGALSGGWPVLAEARGKVLFALDEGPAKVEAYLRGRASLEGLPMFVNSVSEDAPHAAYFTINNPRRDRKRILDAVKAGFLVRTRADANTLEARGGTTGRRDAAFASGAHYISTDYYEPRTEWSDYKVRLPGRGPVRCNPVRRDEKCAPISE